VAFAIIAATVIQLVGEYLFNQRVREEERVTEELSGRISSVFAARNTGEIYSVISATADEYDARILILDAYGICQADSESMLNGYEIAITEVASVLDGTESAYGYYETNHKSPLLASRDGAITGIFTRRLTDENASSAGVILFASSEQDIYDGLLHVTTRIGMIMLAVFVLVGILSFIIIRLFTRPVHDLTRGIQKISTGDFSFRVRVRGKDEFSDLARAFNSMVSRMEILDRSRNQFVSNASHELKTPLSTMKILLQTILYQEVYDPDISKEFLGDIDKEIDRLSYVVSDLLTLVSIDSGEMKLKTAPLSLRDLIQDNVKRLSPLARERGIELDFSGRDTAEIMGDHMKLTQVFYNLIDNAIKYTPRGGRVRVELVRQGKTAVARISDNGIGIPKEDQLHIFDRFYRVDKARSRETGGTGLGLSIVKQIVLLHSGNISVSSLESEGTTFTVELPIHGKQIRGKSA